MIVEAKNAALHMNMPAYVHGFITSMNDSASSKAGILLNTAAIVLFAQCISMVSFSDPVLYYT